MVKVLKTLRKFTLQVKVHYIKRVNLHPLSSTFTRKYLYSLYCPVRIYTNFIFLSFKLKAKKRKTRLDGKSFQVLFRLNTTYPQFPILSVSARQDGTNLSQSGVRGMEWTVVLPSSKESGISGRKCLPVAENCKYQKQEKVNAFEGYHPTPCIRGFGFTYTAALRYIKRRSRKFLQCTPATS
jgi:hypothetical protein